MAEKLSFDSGLNIAPGIDGGLSGLTVLTGSLEIDFGNPPTILPGASLKLQTTAPQFTLETYTNLMITKAGDHYTITGTSGAGFTDLSISFKGTHPSKDSVTITSTKKDAPVPAGLALAGTNDGSVTSTAVCFAAGTQILTTHGNKTVETLEVGDVVVTASGEERPIRYLAHRKFDFRRHPRPQDVLPVRISAHAFADGVPARDLTVSPGHAICTTVVGDVLIPAVALINGSTVQQLDVDELVYWHVELDSHDILVAEALPAESYLDMGNRSFFAEEGVVTLDASPDGDPALRTHADFCRPFRASGAVVDAVREQLRERAVALDWRLSSELDVGLEVDGRRLDPVVRDGTARFLVPEGATDLWLVSRTSRPCDAMKTAVVDNRNLGLCIGGICIDDAFAPAREIAIDNPMLCIGFHDVEASGHRWTSGRARLPAALWKGCETGFYLSIKIAAAPVPYWEQGACDDAASSLVA